MATEKLTAKQVENHDTKGRLADGGGLYLDAKQSGAKAWVYVWRGKQWETPTNKSGRREMGLGQYGSEKSGLISLKKARELASECRALVGDGIDPKLERDKRKEEARKEAEKRKHTFGSLALEYIEANESSWKNPAHRRQWRYTLLGGSIRKGAPDYCKSIRHLPVEQITREHILAILKPIWTEKTETAERLQGRLERVFDFAGEKRLLSSQNPAVMKGNLRGSLARIKKADRVEHYKAMEYEGLPSFMATIQQVDAISSKALQFLILTGTRSSETINARWSEIDLERRIWSIPKVRMKRTRLHEIPLSEAAMAILRPLSVLQINEFVFAGRKPNKPVSTAAMTKTLKRYSSDDETIHGFRSSFRDWVGDETTFEREVAELALSHAVGDATEQAYRRKAALEKRRVLMQAWAGYCTGGATKNVVQLHG